MLRLFGLLILVFGLSSCGNDSNNKENQTLTDVVIYHGGTIVTMEGKEGSTVEAVVTEGKSILFSGPYEEAVAAYPGASDYNLEGRTMMPGFIEQHLHPFLGAISLSMPVIAPEEWKLPDKTWPAAVDAADYIDKLRTVEASMDDPEETLWSWGYHHNFHGELNRSILNELSSNRPIGVWHRSCHEFFVNDAFMNKFGITAEDVAKTTETARAQINLEKGHFYENGAIVYLLPKIVGALAAPDRMRAGMVQMVEMLHQNGVTAFNEPGAVIDPNTIDLYLEILGGDASPMYAYFIPEGNTNFMQYGDSSLAVIEDIKSIFPSEGKIRFFDNQVKFLADGAIISQLMQMKDGYLDGHEGEWMLEPSLLEPATKLYWDNGYQLHIHVNGDKGLEVVLDVIKKRMQENPRTDHRTVIVHFANSSDELVQRLVELGCIVSANPYYVTGFSDKFAEVGLGPERAHSMVRIRPVEEAGVPVSLHSDLPMAPADPLFLAWCAVNRITNEGNIIRPELAISLHQAMRGITIDAAQSWQMEDQLGSIKVGKVANFTILADNPYTTDPVALKDIEVLATVFEGKEYPID